MNLSKFNEYIAIDLETTGLDRENDRVIEIALCHFVDGAPTRKFQSLIAPEEEVRSFILDLTGIDSNELKSAPTPREVFEEALSFIGDLPLVAHNSEMDEHFFKKELEKLDIQGFNNPFWDSLLVSRLAWSHSPNHRLETLVEFLKLDKVEAHRALPDAIQSGKVFSLALREISSFNSEVLTCLAWLAQGTTYESFFENPPAEAPLIPKSNTSTQTEKPTSSAEEVIDWKLFFSASGPLAKEKPGYQERTQQSDISYAVSESLNRNQVACLEAPTGTGKTLAYLSALANHHQKTGERLVIATATKTLQDQIFNSDVPLLNKVFPKVKFSRLKGRDNYLCRRRLQEMVDMAQAHLTPQDRTHIMTLIPWVAKTSTGDISENSSFQSSRCHHLWRLLSGEGRSCNDHLCEGYNCFATQAIKASAQAGILVVNHALLLKDIQLGFSLLPAWDRLLVDEAHRLPNLARQGMGKEIFFYKLRGILHQLNNAQVEHPLIDQIIHSLEPTNETYETAVILKDALKNAEKGFHRFLMKIGRRLKNNREEFYAFKQPLAQLLNLPFHELLEELELAQNFANQLSQQGTVEAFKKPLLIFVSQIREFIEDLRHVFETRDDNEAYWITEWHNPHLLRLHSAPIDLNPIFKKLWPWAKSVVFTSATLTVKGQFDYFIQQLGNEGLHKKRLFSRQFHNDWPLKENRKVIIANFLPAPTEKSFQIELDKTLEKILPALTGSTLCLYTSIRSLRQSHQNLNEVLAENSRFLLAQHIDGTIENLTSLFKKNQGSILLGTQIFWEGVDLPGKQLENLIISKLPFPNPHEPILAARSEMVKAKGGNPFKEIFVSETLMELEQGMGRLIRTAEDKGKLILFDNRIVSQAYGKSFQRLWQNHHQVVNSIDELLKVIND